MMSFDGDGGGYGGGGGKSDGGYLYFFQNFFVVVLSQLYMLSVYLRSTSSLQSSALEISCAPFLLHSPFIVKKNPHGMHLDTNVPKEQKMKIPQGIIPCAHFILDYPSGHA